MVVLDGHFTLGCGHGKVTPKYIYEFQCMLERTDALTNEVLEPITYVLAYQHSATSAISSVIFFRAVCLYIRRAILHTRPAARDRSDFFALQGWDINHNLVTLIYTQKSTLLFKDKKYIKEQHTERCLPWS